MEPCCSEFTKLIAGISVGYPVVWTDYVALYTKYKALAKIHVHLLCVQTNLTGSFYRRVQVYS